MEGNRITLIFEVFLIREIKRSTKISKPAAAATIIGTFTKESIELKLISIKN